MDRGVDVIKGKLIGRNLSIGSHVPLPQEQLQLVLSKVRVHFSKGNHVEGQVPAGILGREGEVIGWAHYNQTAYPWVRPLVLGVGESHYNQTAYPWVRPLVL